MFSKTTRSCQRGVVALLFSLVLLSASAVLAFTVASIGAHEQRVAGNEYRAKQARAIAQAGLEYGVNWLYRHYDPDDGAFWAGEPPAAVPAETALNPLRPAAMSGGTGAFDVQLRFALISPGASRPDAPRTQVIAVHASAVAVDDSQVKARASQYLVADTTFLQTTQAPALVLSGCLGAVSGAPSIHSAAMAPVVSNRNHPVPGDPDCLRPSQNHFVYYGEDGSVYDADADPAAADPSKADEAFSSAWERVFGATSKAFVERMSAEETALVESGYIAQAERSFYWIDCTKGWTAGDSGLSGGCGADAEWDRSLGSASHPVILAFSSATACPRMTPATVIYGIVYIDAPGCPDTAAWTAGTVYGSVLIEGDLGHYHASTALHEKNLSLGLQAGRSFASAYARLPGTWSDF